MQSDGGDESRSRRNVLGNGAWGASQQAIAMGANAVVAVLLIRFLPQEDYGAYAYALALAGLGLSVMTAGLSGLAVKALVSDRPNNASHVTSLLLIREAFALVGYGLIALASLTSGSESTILATLIAGTVLFGRALDSSEMWYSSVMRTSRPAIIRSSCTLVALGVRILLLASGAQLVAMLLVYVLESLVASLLIMARYARDRESPGFGKPSASFVGSMTTKSWPLLLSGMANQVNLRADVIIIQALVGSSAVAVYSAASRISEIAFFLPVVFMNATFPVLLEARRKYGESSAQYTAFLQAAYDRAFWLGVLIAGCLALAGPILVPLLFGGEYAQASQLLSIQVIACPFVFMAAVFSKWIIAESKYWASLVRHGSGAVLNIILNLLLIPVMGLTGAAIATVASYVVASYLSCFIGKSTRPAATQMTLAIVAPIRLIIRRLKSD